MKPKLLEYFTYPDLGGRRRLRRYVVFSLGSLMLVGMLFTYTAWQGDRRQARVLAAPQPLAEADPTWAATPIAPHLPVLASLPTATPTLAECPADPQAWQLVDTPAGGNFKKVEPACVYAGLERTVAWELLHQAMGYPGLEAADALGLAEIPRRPAAEITAMTDTRGPLPIALQYYPQQEGDQARLYPPAYRLWQVDQAGQPGLTYTLRGCFRTASLVGNQVERWDVDYPVLCVLSLDQADWVVMQYEPHVFASRIAPRRLFQLYGYVGEHTWVEIGIQTEPVIQIGSEAAVDGVLSADLETIQTDQALSAERLGVVPWDAAWVEAAFGLPPLPLPPGWAAAGDRAAWEQIQALAGAWAAGEE